MATQYIMANSRWEEEILTVGYVGSHTEAYTEVSVRGVGARGARGASAPPLFSLGVHCTPTFPGEKLSI